MPAIRYFKISFVQVYNFFVVLNSYDFDNTPEKIYNSIKNRVYLVRNAIAHSKEGDKLRYEPFKHDKDLQKEIPLIRAISEEIIINSSKPIDLKA